MNRVRTMEEVADRVLEHLRAQRPAMVDLLCRLALAESPTDDPAAVPQIFAKETVTASKSAIDEQPFIPQVVRATQAFAGLDLDAAPFLLGYVMTRPKPTSEVILATEKGDPLLVWWRYGLGMTVAFTSEDASWQVVQFSSPSSNRPPPMGSSVGRSSSSSGFGGGGA